MDTIKPPDVDHPIDFGVQAYHNLSFVAPFFKRYGINVMQHSSPSITTHYVDESTEEPVNVTQYSADEQNAALGRWLDFGLKYKKYVYPSYNLPSPLGDAAPLARPFIDTVKELNLEPIVVALLDEHWANDLLALPTLHAVSTFGYAWIDGTALVSPESHNNTELYANIQAHLGDKVLLNSRVTSVNPDAKTGTSTLTVNGPGGCTQITAKQIVVGFVPTQTNMAPFDTTPEEEQLFAKWSCVNLHNGLLRIDGFPDGGDLDPVSSDPERFFMPTAPNVRFMSLAGTSYTLSYVIGNPDSDAADAKRLLEAQLQAINEVGTYHVSTKPDYLAFSDHNPLVCSVSPADIEAGFWTQLRALQGERSTYYVGQAMAGDLSAYVWAQAQEVIDMMVSGDGSAAPVVVSKFALFSKADNCAAADSIGSFSFHKGEDSDKCHPIGELAGSATVFGVSETGGDLKCQCEFKLPPSSASHNLKSMC